MTANPMSSTISIRLWLLIGAALALVIAANAHFLYVATSSQPACVAHIRAGEGSAERGVFSAAQSSCSPSKPGETPGETQ